MLERGETVNQRYRIVHLLGQGGFGAVYRAWDIALKKPVALKENLDVSAEAQRQFEREATTLAGLHHSHLPRVTDHFILPEQGQYLVMDFIEGYDLEKIVARKGKISEERGLAWMRPIADALDYLHNLPNPVIHRDVKPANIIVTKDHKPYLVDFGLVKVSNQKRRTTIGARSITPGYAPPEQYGSGGTDARTDLYALAATLYTLLTGITPPESVQRLAGDTLQPAHIANPEVSERVGHAISKAMMLPPAQRFPTMLAFKRALTASAPLGDNATEVIPRPPLPPQPIPPQKSNRYALIGGVAALVLLIGSFIFAVPRMIDSERESAVAEVGATLTQDADSANATSIFEATETQSAENATATDIAQSTTQAQASETETALELTGDAGDIGTATAVAAVTEAALAEQAATETQIAATTLQAAAVEATLTAESQNVATRNASGTETAEAELATVAAEETRAAEFALTETAAVVQAGGTAQAIADQNAAATRNAQNAVSTRNAQNAAATRNAQNAIATRNAQNAAGTRNAQNAASTQAAATRNAQNAASTRNAQNAASTRNAQNAAGTRNAQNAIATQTKQAQNAAAWNATSTVSARQTIAARPTNTPQRGILNGRWGGNSNDNKNNRAWEEFWTLNHSGGGEFTGTISYRGSGAPANSSDSFSIFGVVEGNEFAFIADDSILYGGIVSTKNGRQNLSGTMYSCEDKNGDGDVAFSECDPIGTFELWRL